MVETTLLLVEDEVKLIEAMSGFLQKEGFRIVTATTGKLALAVAKQENPALVVLDWMLPEISGIEVCRELRKMSKVGIIMLTAKTEETDKIVGLEIGADDYMTKPFSLRELAARIRSVLRRLQPHSELDEPQIMERGQLAISIAKYQVLKQDKEIALTPTEFKILITLAAKPGIVYSRLQLMKAAMEEDFINYERTMDSHISNLRKKIEDDPARPQYIQTVFGFGYRFGDRL
jgi:DNA-binding response OmpR family regulator